MDAMLMLRTVVVLLALTAAGGLVMAGIRLSRRTNPPAALAMLHGLLAAAALGLAAFAVFTATLPHSAMIALFVLLVAAAGGAFMNLAFQWKQRLLPLAWIAVHATLAIVGFAFLLLAVYGH